VRSIDEWLKSEETGESFCHCLCCKLPLVELATPWLVNKEYVGDECVMEYAICQPCRNALAGRMSEQSKHALQEFLKREIDWSARIAEFMMAYDLTERFDACIACRTERGQMRGFGISALFDSGGELVTGPLPVLICQPCIGRMMKGLSEESRKVWEDFLNKHFADSLGGQGFSGLF
jgi:hypothetical protein